MADKMRANEKRKCTIRQDSDAQAGVSNERRDDGEGIDRIAGKLGVDKIDEKALQLLDFIKKTTCMCLTHFMNLTNPQRPKTLKQNSQQIR